MLMKYLIALSTALILSAGALSTTSSARGSAQSAFASAAPQIPSFEQRLFERAKGNAHNY